MTEQRHVLDLFCGLGGFSQAFAESDRWSVTTVDIEARFDPDITADVFELRPSDFKTGFDVVLAGVPCTVFTPARNITEGGDDAWNGDTPATDESRDLVALAYHTLGLIHGLAPTYWFVENPIGRLRSLIGSPTATVTQCQYGREHQKPTDLWGDHPPMTYRRCSPGDPCHTETGSYTPGESQPRLGVLAESDDPAARSALPYDLSESIRDACEAALDGDAPEQTELPVATDGGPER
jgi:hypothetical protein